MADIVLLIERIGDELEVSVESDTSPAAPTDNQKARRGATAPGKAHGRGREILEQKRKRKHGGAGGHDHDLSSGPHQTMILVEGQGDKVTFKCDKLFTVDVEFDPAYLAPGDDEPRRSPFLGWDTPQTGKQEGGAGPFIVPAAAFNNDKRQDSGGHSIDNTRPTDHHFYKMTVWSEGLKLDPDWYCDR